MIKWFFNRNIGSHRPERWCKTVRIIHQPHNKTERHYWRHLLIAIYPITFYINTKRLKFKPSLPLVSLLWS